METATQIPIIWQASGAVGLVLLGGVSAGVLNHILTVRRNDVEYRLKKLEEIHTNVVLITSAMIKRYTNTRELKLNLKTKFGNYLHDSRNVNKVMAMKGEYLVKDISLANEITIALGNIQTSCNLYFNNLKHLFNELIIKSNDSGGTLPNMIIQSDDDDKFDTFDSNYHDFYHILSVFSEEFHKALAMEASKLRENRVVTWYKVFRNFIDYVSNYRPENP